MNPGLILLIILGVMLLFLPVLLVRDEGTASRKKNTASVQKGKQRPAKNKKTGNDGNRNPGGAETEEMADGARNLAKNNPDKAAAAIRNWLSDD